MSSTQIAGVDVSRETLDRLESFEAHLRKWTPRINLVAPNTLPQLWTRHIVDSAQLFAHAPKTARHWVDLGSGGGLPGLVCAILAQQHLPDCRFTLIESDKRKSAFLMTTAHALGVPVTVLAQRVEAVPPQSADVVSARALAPLRDLLALVQRHLAEDGVALLPKGRNWAEELAAARAEWQFSVRAELSQTDPDARLLKLKDIFHDAS